MDAIALLKKDHMTVKRLFERFEKDPEAVLAEYRARKAQPKK